MLTFHTSLAGTFLKDANAQGNKNSVNISKNDYVDGVYMMLGLKDDKADEGYTPVRQLCLALEMMYGLTDFECAATDIRQP